MTNSLDKFSPQIEQRECPVYVTQWLPGGLLTDEQFVVPPGHATHEVATSTIREYGEAPSPGPENPTVARAWIDNNKSNPRPQVRSGPRDFGERDKTP
jgi:hypothetical protein